MTDVIVDNAAPEPTNTPGSQAVVDEVLQNLGDVLNRVNTKVTLIRALNDGSTFKFLSKTSRNALTHGLLDDVADLEEIAKVAFRTLKKVKRERVPENVVDLLLGFPEDLIKSKDDFDNSGFGDNELES